VRSGPTTSQDSFPQLDGVKLPGNASMRWGGNLWEIGKIKESIEHMVKQLLEDQITTDKDDGSDFPYYFYAYTYPRLSVV
jgi:hypothetical protein